MATPTQRNLNFRHRNALGQIEPAPLPRPVVEELPVENRNYTNSDKPLTRGQSGLGNVSADSAERIRSNAEFRNAPKQPDLFRDTRIERNGLTEQAQRALDRSKRFTNTVGTIVNEPAGRTPASVKGLGAVTGALAGFETFNNARQVYNATEGDIGETATQVAYDLPAAALGTVGGITGAAIGRRNPYAMTAGSVAGATTGDTAGRQLSSGVDRLLGGDGMSPLQAMRAGQQTDTPTLMDDGGYVLPPELMAAGADTDVPEIVYADDPRHPSYAGTAAPAQPAAQPALGQPVPAAEIIEPAAQQPATQPAGNGYQRTSVDGVVARMGDDGVPEFTNAPDAVAGAQGDFQEGRMGNGLGTLSVVGGGEEAMRRNNAAADTYEQMRESRRQSRLQADARVAQQQIDLNNGRINALLDTGRPADRMRARGLGLQNEQLAGRVSDINTQLGNLELGRQRSADQASILQSERLRLQAERQGFDQSGDIAAAREEAAQRNAENYQDRVNRVFGQQNPDGTVSIPPDMARFIELRQGEYAQQVRQALDQSVADTQRRADAGDEQAAAELGTITARRNQIMADMFRVGPDGEVQEPRPVGEWSEESQNLFFREADAQMRAQADKTDSILPELGGALAGASVGLRTPGGARSKIAGALVGGATGAFAGNQVENEVRGDRSYAPLGTTNQSLIIPSNINEVFTDNGSLMMRTNDGQIVNFSDLIFQNTNPSRYLGVRGDVQNEAAPVVQAAFTKAIQQVRTNGPGSESAAEALRLMAGNNTAAYRNMLTEAQRRQLAEFVNRQ